MEQGFQNKLSQRGNVSPFMVMEVMQRAQDLEKEGKHIIHMEIGQPGTPAPLMARKALQEALEKEPLGYTGAAGLTELRARVAHSYGELHGLEIAPERVIITAGASGAFTLAFTAFFDVGARVGLGLPGYPSYRHILRALSLREIPIRTDEQSRYQPMPHQLEPLNLDGLILASPSNPAGAMLRAEELEALTETAHRNRIRLISDEIYHRLEYDFPATTALAYSDDTIVINSFSKYFSMTGWRIGWMVVPEYAAKRVEHIAQNMFICSSHAAQIAALAAFDAKAELDENLAQYRRNRAFMMANLPEAGFDHIAPPDGAFYFWVNISKFGLDSGSFVSALLHEAGVAATPGYDFDPVKGQNYIRLSYAGSSEDIEEGITRIKKFMQNKGWAT